MCQVPSTLKMALSLILPQKLPKDTNLNLANMKYKSREESRQSSQMVLGAWSWEDGSFGLCTKIAVHLN